MTIQNVQWRLGASATLANWGTNCDDCSSSDNPWHDGWTGNRDCTGLDVQASARAYVYVSGFNPSATSSVTIWLRRIVACAIAAVASDVSPSLDMSDPDSRVVRCRHMDDDYDPRTVPSGSWERLVSVPPRTAFIYVVGKIGPQTGTGSDQCGWASTGPHLHMDAPDARLTRNCSLAIGTNYNTSTTAFEFGS